MSELKTSDLLFRLAHGELANLKMGDLKDGTIRPENLPAVLMQINKGLRDLFTRFLLLKKEIIINTTETITHYYLRYEFAASNGSSGQLVKYLDDSSCEGFEDGVAKILQVYDAFGRQLHMDKIQEPLSVFRPVFDCVQITANHQTEDFHVIFQALHPQVTFDASTDPDTDTVINLPPSLHDPLNLLVASKVYGTLNGEKNLTRSAILHQEYEAKLAEAQLLDTPSVSENISNGKLDQAGFV